MAPFSVNTDFDATASSRVDEGELANLFFVSYGGGHAAALAPVAQQAAIDGHKVTFLALTTARAALVDYEFPLVEFNDLWEFAAPGARAFGAELTADMKAGGPVSLRESEAYHGISFADLVEKVGAPAARKRFAREGRHAFLPTAFFERYLCRARPDVVVATNSPRSEQAALLASGRVGIPSVCIVDLFALQEIQWCGKPRYASRVCVLNAYVRDLFLRAGRREEEIVVTGNPAFDRLVAPEAVRRGQALRAARGWAGDDKLTILWASQIEPKRHPFTDAEGDPNLPQHVERELRKFVRDHKGLRLVVRYHPSQQERFIDEPNVELSPNSEPLDALLHAVDAVVVTASTVGLEAALIGKPVVSVDRSVFTPDTRYVDFGVSRGVRALSDLAPTLLDIRASGGRRSGNAELDWPGGGATRRVLNVIESLLPNGASSE